MKRIIVVVTYEAYVPEDMKVKQVESEIVAEVRARLEDFRVYVEDYKDEEEKEPLFELQGISVGTNAKIAVGKDKGD